MDDRVYFTPGDVVKLKQVITNLPKMIVKSIDKAELHEIGSKPIFLGVSCFWFTHTMEYQVQRFNTKDLEHCNEQC